MTEAEVRVDPALGIEVDVAVVAEVTEDEVLAEFARVMAQGSRDGRVPRYDPEKHEACGKMRFPTYQEARDCVARRSLGG